MNMLENNANIRKEDSIMAPNFYFVYNNLIILKFKV